MRVQLKESKVSNLVLPRGAFLKGLVALIAAPAIVKAESLMPISVWRPRLEAWRSRQLLHLGGAEGRFDGVVAAGSPYRAWLADQCEGRRPPRGFRLMLRG
jgi:hypothetical protein